MVKIQKKYITAMASRYCSQCLQLKFMFPDKLWNEVIDENTNLDGILTF